MATMEGPLSKWTNVMKGWQYRWFVLDETSGILSYYTSKEKMMRGSRRGCVRLKGAVIGIDDEDDSTFTITVDQKTFHFQARDAEERERWIVALENTILRHSNQQKRQEIKHIPTLNEFDQKLAETDAYLQLLIDQVQDLQHRIDDCEDINAKEKFTVIKVTAEAMIEAIKHSIVMLQISKESLRETIVNGTPHEPPLTQIGDHDHTFSNKKSNTTTRSTSPLSQVTSSIASDNNIESAVDVSKIINGVIQPSISLPSLPIRSRVDDHITIDGIMTITDNSEIPVTSYSSSEDEDFFDAEEYGARSAKSSPEKCIIKAQSGDELDAKSHPETDITPKIIASEDDYFDELYDETEKQDLGSMEKHGSIISHLLSQVRIGMDLTKVVLPTFILERRSLLEMFADFFAHPDLFVQIADQESPKDRMVQLVRWYLSAFHAGRNSEIAKKPYNPILGETFSCFYDIPYCDKTDDIVEDGPISGVTKNNLAFIAEQVSHHPPISAFYAEHYNKKITLDGYVWTKSKFLGLSIGVHMIGQAVVSVIDKDEEYIFTFPNGYGRSILTVPWVELGGKINITCAKTGYSANVEFHTKPFYGGRKHRLTAEIFSPNDKKPFCSIDGEWNGVMYAKYLTGMNESFVDTKRIPIVKKKVMPRSQQGEYESRRLWQDCTYNLKHNNMAEATRAKHKLEQRQREEAKERKEHGLKWETKHFHEVGENWVYDRPLIKRVGKTISTPPGTI